MIMNVIFMFFYDSILQRPLLLGDKYNMVQFLKKRYGFYSVKLITRSRNDEITNGFENHS